MTHEDVKSIFENCTESVAYDVAAKVYQSYGKDYGRSFQYNSTQHLIYYWEISDDANYSKFQPWYYYFK